MSQTFTQANAILSVTGLPCGSIGTTTGVDQIAADLLQRPSRQSRARSGHPTDSIPNQRHRYRQFKVSNFAQTPQTEGT